VSQNAHRFWLYRAHIKALSMQTSQVHKACQGKPEKPQRSH
jgi:hypothetical protein